MIEHPVFRGYAHYTWPLRWRAAKRLVACAIPAALILMLIGEIALFVGSVRSMSVLSQDMARAVADNRLPESLVPRFLDAKLPVGSRGVTVVTTFDHGVVMDFTVRTADVTPFGLGKLVMGETMTVRSRVRLQRRVAGLDVVN